MKMLQAGGQNAGFTMPSADGPVRTGRTLYRAVAIVTTLMMLFGTLAFLAPVTHAKAEPASINADLTGVSGTHLSVGASDTGTLNAQVSPGLVDLLVATLLDLVGAVQAEEEVAAPPVNEATGIVGIIYAAADAYGQPRDAMLRVAKCESHLNPQAVNSSSGASGLFQFMPGTWESTPYADQDIFDPVANANAAAWMWSVGRRNEWTCQ